MKALEKMMMQNKKRGKEKRRILQIALTQKCSTMPRVCVIIAIISMVEMEMQQIVNTPSVKIMQKAFVKAVILTYTIKRKRLKKSDLVSIYNSNKQLRWFN